jgi:hypothetical protein
VLPGLSIEDKVGIAFLEMRASRPESTFQPATMANNTVNIERGIPKAL